MLRQRLTLETSVLEEINRYLMDPGNRLINEVLRVIHKYGTPEEINAQARHARHLPNMMNRLENMDSHYLKDLQWLVKARDKDAFIPITEYRKSILKEKASSTHFHEGNAVTLEISALQYFPWLIAEAERAIDERNIMPGRYIRVRKMREQEEDNEILAIAAAMQIIGASYVETLDTKGTDGSNVHLGGPDTITGYFGGIGQPNEHALQWVDEYLYYYTRYGIDQVLNINPGTVFLGYLIFRLGINVKFKVSVFMGNDNPYAVLWTLMMARLFARENGDTPLEGFNVSNSVDNTTLEMTSDVRKALKLEDKVRIEHHITEAYKSIVVQPYNRRAELVEIAHRVPNISAKHEGGDPETEVAREHPSDILDYFRSKHEILESGDMENLLRNFLDKHDAVNLTARRLTEKGLSFIGARRLHRR